MLHIDFTLVWIASLFIYGLNFATDYEPDKDWKLNGFKNLLWRLKYWSIKLVGEYWTRPLFSCTMCMSSVWGSVIYLLFSTNYNPFEWLITIVVIAGLNRVLRNFV